MTLNDTVPDAIRAIEEALAAPFEPDEVKWKPAVVSGNRALALAYIDARVIQDRLDDVLGVASWQDEYQFLPDGNVVCKLRLRIGGEWITKMDVGGPSEQPDEGDRRKAAVSDALKRAAVKFGIGRYLYRLPQQWADYDPQKRQFTRKPTLPANALPKKTAQQHSAQQSATTNGQPQPQQAPTTQSGDKLPANGAELQKRLYAYDRQLAEQGLCAVGDLVKHVVAAGVQAGFEPDLATWTMPAIQLALGETRAFEAKLRQPAQQQQPQQQQPQKAATNGQQPARTASAPIKDGTDFARRVRTLDKQLAGEGKIKAGDLVAYLARLGAASKMPHELEKWPEAGWKLAEGLTKEFLAKLQTSKGNPKVSQKTLAKLKGLCQKLKLEDGEVLDKLAAYRTSTLEALTEPDALELCTDLEESLAVRQG